MQTISLSDLKAHLSENVQRAEVEHEQYTITRNGRPSVVMVSADEWESIQETLFWLSRSGIAETLEEARADVDEGRVFDEAQAREALGLPVRPARRRRAS